MIGCVLLAKQIDQLLYMCLRPEETEQVVSYLKKLDTPQSCNLLVMYYLQQSKVAEAVQLDSTIMHVSMLFFSLRLQLLTIN